jgi:hypothetical protein
MTKDEIIEFAEKAGLLRAVFACDEVLVWEAETKHLQRFADLVAKNERNACAKVLTENAAQCTKGGMNEYILTSNAQAILERGQK